MEILQTQNPTWGFFGEFGHHTVDHVVAWAAASEAIAKATDCPAKDVKTFLDSSKGREFAEGVIEHMSTNELETIETAIDFAVAKLMRHNLTGIVTNCELEKDTGEGRTHRAQPF